MVGSTVKVEGVVGHVVYKDNDFLHLVVGDNKYVIPSTLSHEVLSEESLTLPENQVIPESFGSFLHVEVKSQVVVEKKKKDKKPKKKEVVEVKKEEEVVTEENEEVTEVPQEVNNVEETKTEDAPKVTKRQLAQKIYDENPKAKRKDIIQRFMAELNMTPAGSSTYYHLCAHVNDKK